MTTRPPTIPELLGDAFDRESGVPDVAAFDPVEAVLGLRLPATYKGFLMWANGGEALNPLPRLRFYSLEELLPRRADGQPPDTLEFATDDSDGFAFDLLVSRSAATYPVVRYSLGETTRDEIELAGNDFHTFILWQLNPAARYSGRP